MFGFLLLTDAARNWVDENVDVADYQWRGGAFWLDSIDYAQPLAEAMSDAGRGDSNGEGFEVLRG